MTKAKKETKIKSKAKVDAKPKAKPKVAAKSAAKAKPKLKLSLSIKPKLKSRAKPKKVEPKAKVKARSRLRKPKAEAKVAATKPVVKSKSVRPKAKIKTKSPAKTKLRPKPKPKAEVKPTELPKELALPLSVVTKTDLSKLVSELERADDELTTAEVRKKVSKLKPSELALSAALEDFLKKNKLTLDNSATRSALIRRLRRLKSTVPVIHMTFAATADPSDLQEVALWLRKSIHPQVVVSVGLQPSLVAGVYMRTPNRVHDLSLRHLLEGKRETLIEKLEALSGKN